VNISVLLLVHAEPCENQVLPPVMISGQGKIPISLDERVTWCFPVAEGRICQIQFGEFHPECAGGPFQYFRFVNEGRKWTAVGSSFVGIFKMPS
jgi:hypothetical protein